MTTGGYNLGAAHGVVTIDTTQAIASLTALRSALSGMGAAGTGAGDAIADAAAGTSALGQAATVAGVGAAVFLGLAIKQAASFEFRMDAVASVLGESGEIIDRLTDKIIALGAATSFTTNEVATIAQELAKMGLGAETLINGALEAVTSLSAATETAPDIAATILGAAINSYQLTGEDAVRVADLFTRAANQSASDVTTLGSGFTYAASTAKALGIPIEELIVMLEALNDRGLRGSVAGTSLNQMLLSMTAPTDAARAKMKELGITLEDAEGNFIGVLPVLQQLHAALGDLGDVERLDILDTIFGTRGGRAVLQLLSATQDEVIEANNGWNGYRRGLEEGATAAEQAEERLDNLAGSVEKLKGAFESLFIVVATPLLGGLKAVVDVLTALVDAMVAMNPAILKFATALAAPLAVFGVLQAVAKITGVSFLRMIPGMKAVGAAAGALSGPLAVLTAVLGGLALAWSKNIFGIRDFANELWDNLQPKLQLGQRIISHTTDMLAAMWRGAFDPGDNWNNDAFGEILQFGGLLHQLGVSPEVGYSFVEFGKRFSRTVRRARNMARDAQVAFGGMWDILTGDTTTRGIVETGKRLQRLFGEDIGASVLRATSALRQDLIKFFDTLGAEIGLDFSDMFEPEKFSQRMKRLANALSRYFTYFQKQIMPVLGRGLDAALRGTSRVIQFLTRNMSNFFDVARAGLRIAVIPIATWFRVLGRLLRGDVSGAIDAVADGIGDIADAFVDLGRAAGRIALDIGGAVWGWLGQIDFSALADAVWREAGEAFDTGREVAIGFIATLGSGVWGGLGSFAEWLRDKLGTPSAPDGTGGPDDGSVSLGDVALSFVAKLGNIVWGAVSSFSAWLWDQLTSLYEFSVEDAIPATLKFSVDAAEFIWGSAGQPLSSWLFSQITAGGEIVVDSLVASLKFVAVKAEGEMQKWADDPSGSIRTALGWAVGTTKEVAVGTLDLVVGGINIIGGAGTGDPSTGGGTKQGFAGAIIDAVAGALESVVGAVAQAPGAIKDALVGLGEAIVNLIIFALNFEVDGEAVYAAMEGLGLALGSLIGRGFIGLVGLIDDAMSAASGTMHDASFQDIVAAHIEAIATIFEYAVKGAGAAVALAGVFTNLGLQIMTAIAYGIAGLASGLAQGVAGEFDVDLGGIANSVVGAVVDSLVAAFDYVWNDFDAVELLGDLGTRIWDFIIRAITSIFGDSGDEVDGEVITNAMQTTIKKALPTTADEAGTATIGEQVGAALLEGVANGLSFALESGGALLDSAVSAMGDFINDLVLLAIDKAPGIPGWLRNYLKSKIGDGEKTDKSDVEPLSEVPQDTITMLDEALAERQKTLQQELDDLAREPVAAPEAEFAPPEAPSPTATPEAGAEKMLAAMGLGANLDKALEAAGSESNAELLGTMGGVRDDALASIARVHAEIERELSKTKTFTLPKINFLAPAGADASSAGLKPSDIDSLGAAGAISIPAPDMSALAAAVDASKRTIESLSVSTQTTMTSLVSTTDSQARAAGANLDVGIRTGVTSAINAIGILPGAINSALAAAAGAAFTSGQMVGIGMANGIRSQIDAAVAAAQEMANRVSAAASSALREGSPSRVFMEKGRNIGRGLIIGMERTFAQVEFASRQLANATLAGDSALAAAAASRSTPAVIPYRPQASPMTQNTYNTNLTVDMSRVQKVNDVINFVNGLGRSVETVTSTSRKG